MFSNRPDGDVLRIGFFNSLHCAFGYNLSPGLAVSHCCQSRNGFKTHAPLTLENILQPPFVVTVFILDIESH